MNFFFVCPINFAVNKLSHWFTGVNTTSSCILDSLSLANHIYSKSLKLSLKRNQTISAFPLKFYPLKLRTLQREQFCRRKSQTHDFVKDNMAKPKSTNLSYAIGPILPQPTMETVVNRTKENQDSDLQGGISCSQEEESFLRISFSVIVLCTIIGSFLVCAVNIKNKGMLRSPYNVNIFHLAITDVLVSFVIFLTPGFIFEEIPPAPEGTLSGEIFCRVVSSHFLTFSTATTSIYITVALATERWYAVAKPLQYRAKFHRKRLICEVFILWALSLFANSLLLFEVKYNPEKNSASERCEIIKIPSVHPSIHKLLGIAQFAFKFVIPFAINCNLYARVLRATKKSRVLSRRIGLDMRHNISRMAAVSTMVLALCWLPNQAYYLCFAFDLVRINTPVHFSTIVIALINPCLNPFIFAFHSAQYRDGFRNLFCGEYVGKDKMNLNHRLNLLRPAPFRQYGPENLRAPSSPTHTSIRKTLSV